jgi:hypothetical protein
VARHAWRGALGIVLAMAGQAMEAAILLQPPWQPNAGCTLPEAAAQFLFTDAH